MEKLVKDKANIKEELDKKVQALQDVTEKLNSSRDEAEILR